MYREIEKKNANYRALRVYTYILPEEKVKFSDSLVLLIKKSANFVIALTLLDYIIGYHTFLHIWI